MQQTIVKTYKGRQQEATEAYQADASKMAQQGYSPTSQVWTAGSYGCGSFIVALLLCVVVIGILVFIYMLIVKPTGMLTVTYTLAPRADPEKVCPKCAERVKVAAAMCRFCGHAFDSVPATKFEKTAAASVAPGKFGAEQLGNEMGKLFAKKPSQK